MPILTVTSPEMASLRRCHNIYATAHDNPLASGWLSCPVLGQGWSGANFYCCMRAPFYWDTTPIPVTALVTAVTIRFLPDVLFTDTSHFDVVIRNGMPDWPKEGGAWPFMASSYNFALYSGDGGSINSAAIVVLAWNNIVLNATGIGWVQTAISAGLSTKFMLMSSNDISSTPPPGAGNRNNTVRIDCMPPANQIQLIVTYVNPAPPTCTTNPATGVGDTAATLNGFLDDDGGMGAVYPCDCGFEWGETIALGNTTSTTPHNTGEAITHFLVGLDPCKTYYFRTFGTNPMGTCYGAIMSYKTTGCPVTQGSVQTLPATRVSENAARLNGLVADSLGRHMSVAFEYGLTTDYGMKTGWQQAFITGDEFRADIRNLGEGQSYHCRAMMTGSGIVYGSDVAFKTPVGTGPVTMVEQELVDLLEVDK